MDHGNDMIGKEGHDRVETCSQCTGAQQQATIQTGKHALFLIQNVVG